MRRDKPLTEKACLVYHLCRRHAVPAPYLLDLGSTLREVCHHAHIEAPALAAHLPQEVTRAGVDRVWRQHHAGATVERSLPALVEIDGIAQGALSNRRLIIPDPVVDAREI